MGGIDYFSSTVINLTFKNCILLYFLIKQIVEKEKRNSERENVVQDNSEFFIPVYLAISPQSKLYNESTKPAQQCPSSQSRITKLCNIHNAVSTENPEVTNGSD